MLSSLNRRKLDEVVATRRYLVGTGYKRVRSERGVRKQRFELRFDGVAGCLRTPEGGSSRQVLIIVDHGNVRTRLLTVRETARLMGAPDTYQVPGSYNDGYRAMGDAVAVPVTRWLARHLLAPLARPSKMARPWPENKTWRLHECQPVA
jgi:DNA (cytosine-5)-methyltransferase 1